MNKRMESVKKWEPGKAEKTGVAIAVTAFGILAYEFIITLSFMWLCVFSGAVGVVTLYSLWLCRGVAVAYARALIARFDAEANRERMRGEFVEIPETGGLIRNQHGQYINTALNPHTFFTAETAMPGGDDAAQNARWLAHARMMRSRSAGGAGQEMPFFIQEAETVTPEMIGDDSGNVLPLLLSLDRLLIVGGMGAGKTSAMQHLALNRGDEGECIVIDSHAAPDTWPANCRVVGRGRDYEAVKDEITAVSARMDSRYKRLASGATKEGEFPVITLIIDEFTVVNSFCDISKNVKSIMCECRKVGIRLVIGGQSDRAASLGIKGNADLVQGFEAVVYLSKEPQTGIRYADVKYAGSKEKARYIHPGAYVKGDRHNVPSRHGVPAEVVSDGNMGHCVTDGWTREDYEKAIRHMSRGDEMRLFSHLSDKFGDSDGNAQTPDTVGCHPVTEASPVTSPGDNVTPESDGGDGVEIRIIQKAIELKKKANEEKKAFTISSVSTAVWGDKNSRRNQKVKDVLTAAKIIEEEG